MDRGGRVNPYAAPAPEPLAADAPVTTSGAQLASRGARLGAACIDGLVATVLITPLQYAAGNYDKFPQYQPLSGKELLGWWAVGLVFWLATHSYFIREGSQTLGKRLLGLQIVNEADEKPASYLKIVLIRYLPVHLAMVLPYLGSIATMLDVLFIFRKDYRCFHDHIAGTRVIIKPRS